MEPFFSRKDKAITPTRTSVYPVVKLYTLISIPLLANLMVTVLWENGQAGGESLAAKSLDEVQVAATKSEAASRADSTHRGGLALLLTRKGNFEHSDCKG